MQLLFVRILSLNGLSRRNGVRRTWCRSLGGARLKGLGLNNKVAGLTLAWTPGAGTVILPVYYRWSFETGPRGDFASLVRRFIPSRSRLPLDFARWMSPTPAWDCLLPDTALPVEGALKRYPRSCPLLRLGRRTTPGFRT
jgi:hypothetical protein